MRATDPRRSMWLDMALAMLMFAGGAAANADDTIRTWPPALVERLPPQLRLLAKRHAEGPERQLQALQAVSPDALLAAAIGDIAEDPAGLEDLLASIDRRMEPALRLQIVSSLAQQGYAFALSVCMSARVSECSSYLRLKGTIESLILAAPSAEERITLTESLLKLERLRLLTAFEKARHDATVAGDRQSADLLRRKSFELFYGALSLPKFAARPPAVFMALPPSMQSVRVLVFGDFGTGDNIQHQVARAMRNVDRDRPFDLGVTLGDNFYPAGLDDPASPRWATDWEDVYGPLGIAVYATLGNHDYLSPDSPAAQLAYHSNSWRMPAPYYTFQAGPAQFFAIDTTRLYDEQLDWLASQLEASSAPWKIVYGHHPIYSASEPDREGDPESLVHRLLPVLQATRADIYLAGHTHNLQDVGQEGNVHLFVAGGGGRQLYELRPDYRRALFASKMHGFAVLDIESARLGVSLIDKDGRVLHRRDIERGSGGSSAAKSPSH